jgi:hypothetical protein
MSDFAKLVRASDGAQVLFLKDSNDEGCPTLYQYTAHDGITAKMGIVFADDVFGDASCDKAFQACDVAAADAFRKRIVELMTP